jgi:hypothetical protein
MNKTKGNKLQESRLWKDSVGALQKMWDNYLEVLATYFQRMSRLEQEQLITKYSWIIAMGGVGLIWCQIYNFVPPVLRVIGFPLSLAFAYWFGKTIVSRIMIDRLSKYLK